MANIAKMKRDRMLAFLEELKLQHNDDETIRAFNEIENHILYKFKKERPFTITKDGKNQRIDIGFDKREYKKQSIDYMYISKKDFELPENIYDFVIDPGHGGKDSGEKKGEHTEKDIALDLIEVADKECMIN